MPPTPPNIPNAFVMRDMQISKFEKKNSWPPPPKSWLRPCYLHNMFRIVTIKKSYKSKKK